MTVTVSEGLSLNSNYNKKNGSQCEEGAFQADDLKCW